MLGRPVPTNAPTPGFAVFLSKINRMVAKLVAERAHCDLVIQFRDGKIELVRVNQSLLPNQLPDV